MFSNDLVCQMIEYINQNISRKITMAELSSVFFYHKDYLMRIFKREIHCTISNYMNRLRIYQSLQELQFSNHSILRIGLNHGFSSLEYYSETFHHIMGVSPTVYQNFSRRFIGVEEKDIPIIQKSLAELSSFFQFVTYYLGNRQKKLSKSLSIFK